MDLNYVKLFGAYTSAKISPILSDKVVGSEGDEEQLEKPKKWKRINK